MMFGQPPFQNRPLHRQYVLFLYVSNVGITMEDGLSWKFGFPVAFLLTQTNTGREWVKIAKLTTYTPNSSKPSTVCCGEHAHTQKHSSPPRQYPIVLFDCSYKLKAKKARCQHFSNCTVIIKQRIWGTDSRGTVAGMASHQIPGSSHRKTSSKA